MLDRFTIRFTCMIYEPSLVPTTIAVNQSSITQRKKVGVIDWLIIRFGPPVSLVRRDALAAILNDALPWTDLPPGKYASTMNFGILDYIRRGFIASRRCLITRGA